MRKKIIALLLVVVVSSVSTGIYILSHETQSPHLGVVSKSTMSVILNTSSITVNNVNASKPLSGFPLPGNANGMLGASYEIFNGSYSENLVIISYSFNTMSHAKAYYDNLSNNFILTSSLENNSYKGFLFTWYGNASHSRTPFYSVGIDGRFSFTITSLTYLTSNVTTVRSLIQDQIDSMLN